MTIELFDAKGHVAGGRVLLQSPPCVDGIRPRHTVTVSAISNVMGLAHVSLTVGGWEIESFEAEPGVPRVDAGLIPPMGT